MPGMETRAPERQETSSGFLRVAELRSHDLFGLAKGRLDLGLELRRVGLAVGVVVVADFGGDGEAGGDGQADEAHLGEVGTLAAEEVLHLAVAVGLAAAEEVDVLGGHGIIFS